MIAPLSINSSHADCRPERSFFSAHALVTETVPSSSRRALPGRKLQFTNPFIILSLRASERASGSIIDGPGQVGAIAGRPAHDHWMNSPSSGRIQPLFACDELHLCRSIHRTQTAGLSAPFFVARSESVT